MDVLRDPAHIGVFEPHEVDALQKVYAELRGAMLIGGDEARERSLARSIIKLYRHGVKEPAQLVDALRIGGGDIRHRA